MAKLVVRLSALLIALALSNQQWIDPVGYEYIAALDKAYFFEVQLIDDGPPQSIRDRSFILGSTFGWSNWDPLSPPS